MIAYLRVSTEMQGESGMGLAAQREAIEEGARRKGLNIELWQQDVASAGNLERPALTESLTLLEAGAYSGLIVAKLDRLSRSLLDFATLADKAAAEGWQLVVLDPELDMTTPSGRAMAQMLAVFAEFEREMISQRIKDALAAVKAHDAEHGIPDKPSVWHPDVSMRELHRGKQSRLGRPLRLAEPVASTMVRLHLRGLTPTEISRKLAEKDMLNSNGVPYDKHSVRLALRARGYEPGRKPA